MKQEFQSTLQKFAERVDKIQGALESSLNISLEENKMEEADEKGVTDTTRTEYMTHETVMERLKEKESLQLEESVWDAALFIGCPVVGDLASLFTVFSLLINVGIQLFFCMMARGPMIRDMKLDAEEVRIWRETMGHSFASHDPMMKSSLVSRVCADDGSLNYATMQTDAVHDILLYQDLYFGEGTPYVGILLCLIVLFVWFLTMAQELLSIWMHFVAYWHVPKSLVRTVFFRTEEGLNVKHVGRPRICFVCLILVCRLVIACSLLHSGATWLCKTFSVPDLVLNGAALAFITDIDDIIFKTIVPRGAAFLVVSLEPMDLGRPWIWRGLGGRWMFLMGAFAFTSFMAWDELLPFNRKLEDTMRYMCAGDQHFFYNILPNGTFAFTPTETYDGQDGDLEARKIITARVGDWLGEFYG
eukprot:gnl/TRDRNA2_/TRDRNA2_155194_c0_seq1.p1 gnl/TRDRNA2_/TRDRNA2_155194_c0~~gnl/TRDRNA2_/TRDRNA2_155194_c0_seq1.p1  ORF type:complete len:416 (+),score=55.36 gnl/TRDRNA2_/TRDRNA2_155194_c0_seq1:160-1407(+)